MPYGIKYNMVVKQPDNVLSKMYDEKNELIVNLRIPTNEYRDEDLQELIKWSTLSNFDDGYFRNLAIYIKLNENHARSQSELIGQPSVLERTIVFTHAYIRLNRKINTKEDYVDIELIVNQCGDKFVGVVFGEKLEETLKEAKDKVQNPPKLNIIVPVVTEETITEGFSNESVCVYYLEKSKPHKLVYGTLVNNKIYLSKDAFSKLGKSIRGDKAWIKSQFSDALFISKSKQEYPIEKNEKIERLKNFANTYNLINDNIGKNHICFVGHSNVLDSWLVYQSKRYPGLATNDISKELRLSTYNNNADDMTYSNKTISELENMKGVLNSHCKWCKEVEQINWRKNSKI